MNEHQKPPHTRVSLKLVQAPKIGAVVTAPPVLIASIHTVDYCCAHCATVLMHADAGQVRNLLIKCTACGSYNSTDS
jgi:phage FluMu protein Com